MLFRRNRFFTFACHIAATTCQTEQNKVLVSIKHIPENYVKNKTIECTAPQQQPHVKVQSFREMTPCSCH